MNIMVWIWLAVFLVAVVVELATPQFLSLWFALAAVVCLGLSFIPGLPWWAQVLIFAVLSTVLLICLRPICNKYFLRKQVATNVDSLIGREVRMLTEANFDVLGTAKVGDVVWNIKSQDDSPLLAGEVVKVLSVEGNKLIATHAADVDSQDNKQK